MMNVFIIGRILYFIFELAFRIGNKQEEVPACIDGVFGYASLVAFASAVAFNTSNWWYQTLMWMPNEHRNEVYANVFLVGSQSCLLIYFMGISFTSWVLDMHNLQTNKVFGTLYGVIFLMLGVIYAAIGIRFYQRLKHSFPAKFREMKNRVLLSIVVISTLLTLRGGFNTIRYFTPFDSKLVAESLK